MRRLTTAGIVASALVLAACGGAPSESSTAPPDWGLDEAGSTPSDQAQVHVSIPGAGPTLPRITTLPSGSWVRDEVGNCVEREDWLVIAADGALDHIMANRNSCGAPSLTRHVGRWTTDQQVARLRWSNHDENVARTTTFWAGADALQLGAYVPADGGWFRSDTTTREVEGHHSSSSVEVGLRVDGLELSDGALCTMSATVTVAVDGAETTQSFEFQCHVREVGDGFDVVADGMWGDGGWRNYLERRGVFSALPARVATALYEGFQPVLHTVDGRALWHERGESVYRFTRDSPPTSTDELGE